MLDRQNKILVVAQATQHQQQTKHMADVDDKPSDHFLINTWVLAKHHESKHELE